MKLCILKTVFAVLLTAAPLQAVVADDNAAGCRSAGVRDTVAANTQEVVNPVRLATKTLESLGAERQARTAALEALRKEAAGAEHKLNELHGHYAAASSELQSLHRLVSKGCYPFCLNGVQYCNRNAAQRRVSAVMARASAIKGSIAILDQNLQCTYDEADQITARIVELEARIAVVPVQATRCTMAAIEVTSTELVTELEAMLPKETAKMAEHRLKVAAFLAAPLEGESITAEGSGNAAVR